MLKTRNLYNQDISFSSFSYLKFKRIENNDYYNTYNNNILYKCINHDRHNKIYSVDKLKIKKNNLKLFKCKSNLKIENNFKLNKSCKYNEIKFCSTLPNYNLNNLDQYLRYQNNSLTCNKVINNLNKEVFKKSKNNNNLSYIKENKINNKKNLNNKALLFAQNFELKNYLVEDLKINNLLLMTTNTLYSIYTFYFPFELNGSNDKDLVINLSRKSFFEFSKDFLIYPDIINYNDIETLYNSEVNNIYINQNRYTDINEFTTKLSDLLLKLNNYSSMHSKYKNIVNKHEIKISSNNKTSKLKNCINYNCNLILKRYLIGYCFNYISFISLLIKISLYAFKDDHTSNYKKILKLLERMELSDGFLKKYLKSKNRTYINKYSNIISKEVYLTLNDKTKYNKQNNVNNVNTKLNNNKRFSINSINNQSNITSKFKQFYDFELNSILFIENEYSNTNKIIFNAYIDNELKYNFESNSTTNIQKLSFTKFIKILKDCNAIDNNSINYLDNMFASVVSFINRIYCAFKCYNSIGNKSEHFINNNQDRLSNILLNFNNILNGQSNSINNNNYNYIIDFNSINSLNKRINFNSEESINTNSLDYNGFVLATYYIVDYLYIKNNRNRNINVIDCIKLFYCNYYDILSKKLNDINKHNSVLFSLLDIIPNVLVDNNYISNYNIKVSNNILKNKYLKIKSLLKKVNDLYDDIFRLYSDNQTYNNNKTKMNYNNLIMFLKDFDIYPKKISNNKLKQIFNKYKLCNNNNIDRSFNNNNNNSNNNSNYTNNSFKKIINNEFIYYLYKEDFVFVLLEISIYDYFNEKSSFDNKNNNNKVNDNLEEYMLLSVIYINFK